MTEIAHRAPNQLAPALQPMSIDEKIRYAQCLAEGSLLPKAYQRNPGNMLIAIEMGESIGIRPMQAVWEVHIIDGKPAASSGLISGLVRRAGHIFRIKGDDTSATAEIIRRDDPDFTYSVTWDMDRARKAELTGKANWKKYPAAMLKARAITEVARDACEDALMGIQYTPEELGATVDEEGNVVEQTGPRGTHQRGGRFGLSGNFQQPSPAAPPAEHPTPAPAPAPEPEDDDETAEAEDAPVMSDRAQWDQASAAMESIGITDKQDKATEMRRWLDEQGITRQIKDMRDMTADEVDGFISYLRQIANPDAS